MVSVKILESEDGGNWKRQVLASAAPTTQTACRCRRVREQIRVEQSRQLRQLSEIATYTNVEDEASLNDDAGRSAT